MKSLLNFVLVGFILYVASCLFPETVQIDGFWTLVLATVLFEVISLFIGIICIITITIGATAKDALWIIIGIIASLFSEVITMYALSNFLDGFTIDGFWPKVLLSVCFTLLGLMFRKKRKEDHTTDNIFGT